jgi:hypothetical protein
VNLMKAVARREASKPERRRPTPHQARTSSVGSFGAGVEKADITMPELAAEFPATTGERLDPASLSRWLIRAGYLQKNSAGKRARSARPKQVREEWIGVRQPKMQLEPYCREKAVGLFGPQT